MKHFASPDFWYHYRKLPQSIQKLADKNFEMLKTHPESPSLRLKKVGCFYSVRVGIRYRAVAKDRTEGLVWIWIGPHDAYDDLLAK